MSKSYDFRPGAARWQHYDRYAIFGEGIPATGNAFGRLRSIGTHLLLLPSFKKKPQNLRAVFSCQDDGFECHFILFTTDMSAVTRALRAKNAANTMDAAGSSADRFLRGCLPKPAGKTWLEVYTSSDLSVAQVESLIAIADLVMFVHEVEPEGDTPKTLDETMTRIAKALFNVCYPTPVDEICRQLHQETPFGDGGICSLRAWWHIIACKLSQMWDEFVRPSWHYSLDAESPVGGLQESSELLEVAIKVATWAPNARLVARTVCRVLPPVISRGLEPLDGAIALPVTVGQHLDDLAALVVGADSAADADAALAELLKEIGAYDTGVSPKNAFPWGDPLSRFSSRDKDVAIARLLIVHRMAVNKIAKLHGDGQEAELDQKQRAAHPT